MADNILESRILLRYGTFSQWMNSDLILLQGEVAVATFPRISTLLNTGDTPENTPPAIGLKIGDGTHYFDELPWVQGIAADVYSWAKSSTKPVYAATEITGLTEFINAAGGGSSGGGSAATAYRITYNTTTNKYTLQYYDSEQDEWVDTTSEINLADIYNRISTIERWANGATTRLGNIEVPISEYVYEELLNYMVRLTYNDSSIDHQFVTSVTQTNGKISVVRSIISAADITAGVLPTQRGGTGLNFVEDDEVLIGSETGEIRVRKFVTEIDNNRNAFATVGAIKDYVESVTAGITGAMHFIGEATVPIAQTNSRVDPQITGYTFRNAEAGDVILANNSQEFVWTGEVWRLLGDEGSYAVKGSITNADIAEEANIAQSKIAGLIDDLSNKVTMVEGKGLSSNDFTDEDKEKLDNLDANAQENVIEHIFINDTEVSVGTVGGLEKSVNLLIPVFSAEDLERLATAEANVIEHVFVNGTEIFPATINTLPKSIAIDFTPFTEEEKTKLHNIEAEAQVNTVEKLTINGTEYLPDNNKNIDILIDQAALNLDVLTGARVPGITTGSYEDVDVTAATKQLELARIAKTGLISDALQTSGTYFVIYCGSATEVV